MVYKPKNYFLFVSAIIAGVIVGGILGDLLGNIPVLSFLKAGVELGSMEPIKLNLMIIQVAFGLLIKINIMSVVGLFAGYFVGKKIA